MARMKHWQAWVGSASYHPMPGTWQYKKPDNPNEAGERRSRSPAPQHEELRERLRQVGPGTRPCDLIPSGTRAASAPVSGRVAVPATPRTGAGGAACEAMGAVGGCACDATGAGGALCDTTMSQDKSEATA